MRAPQAEANCRARSGDTHSSSLLITTVALNGSRSRGMGTKPSVPGGYFGDSTSLGATRSAPLIFANSEGVASLARCATVAQPRLCAASTTGPGALRTAGRPDAFDPVGPRLGVSQFSCSTRQVCLQAEVRARGASAYLLLSSDLAFSKCSAYHRYPVRDPAGRPLRALTTIIRVFDVQEGGVMLKGNQGT